MSNKPLTKNEQAIKFVDESAALLQPKEIVWIDGSKAQLDQIRNNCLKSGELIELNQKLLPGCYLHRSAVNDVARVEDRTFICSDQKADAGPLNNWMAPEQAKTKLTALFKGSMKGRTMYVIPFSMGIVGSEFAKVGIEITDSAYVVLNMAIMTRAGKECLDALGNSNDFVRGLHCTATLSADDRYICHFPKTNEIWSINSGYGGNALLGKKCFALRIASNQAKNEGWMAEHMVIMGVERPNGDIRYFLAAFPSQCGKTNIAMLVPPEKYLKAGYKVWCVGDDIAWLRVGKDGRLWAMNPENGFFGVAPGTSDKTNPNALKAVQKDTIFTNVVHDLDNNTVWWEGMGVDRPKNALNWKGEKLTDEDNAGAHANSRFTTACKNSPAISKEFDNPKGVPISGIIFGGRRIDTVPLVYGAFDWNHGVFVGSTIGSSTTAAQAGAIGVTRRDPMAMLPFIGYHVGDYFKHWIEMGKKIEVDKQPRIFCVNWFKKDKDGKFMWPGFGENLRVLDWMYDVCENGGLGKNAAKTAIGLMPTEGGLDVNDLGIKAGVMHELLKIDKNEWRKELDEIKAFYERVDDGKMPKELKDELKNLEKRIKE